MEGFTIKNSQRLFHQFLLLYRPFENKLIQVLASHNIQRAQWTILFYLYEKTSATLVELSQYQGVEKPTITRTIQQLEKLGLVEQVLSNDKREKKMKLTEHGKKVYLDVRIPVDEFEEQILQGISEKDIEQTTNILSHIRNNLLIK